MARKRIGRNPYPDHHRILRRCYVEEPVKLEAIDIASLRRLVISRVGEKLVPDIERILFALELFLARDLVGRPTEPGRLRLIRHAGGGRGKQLALAIDADERQRSRRSKPCRESVQILFLFGREACRVRFRRVHRS